MKTKSFINLLKSSMYLIVAALMMGTVISCSNEEFETPKYASDAAKYKIADQSSAIASVELTESGNYIISPHKTMAPAAAANNSAAVKFSNGIWRAPMQLVPSSLLNLLCGEYHKVGEGKYVLDGFGTITITWDAANKCYTISIVTANGETQVYVANKENHKNDGSMSDKLCRTWEVESFAYSLKKDGKVVLKEAANNMYDLAEKIVDKANKDSIVGIDIKDWTDIDKDEVPVKVIFSKSGSYAVSYLNDEVDVALWKWKNEKVGLLIYDWEADDMEDVYDDDDYASVEFKDGKLRVVEGDIDDEPEGLFEEYFTVVLHEVK